MQLSLGVFPHVQITGRDGTGYDMKVGGAEN